MLSDEILLLFNSFSLFLNHLVSLLWAEVRLEILLFHLFTEILAVTIDFDLLGKETQVLDIVLATQLRLMNCNQIFFVLLPSELLPLKLSRLLHTLALLLETFMGKLVCFLEVLHELRALLGGVVIHLVGAVAPHEVRVSLRVVAGRNLFPV